MCSYYLISLMCIIICLSKSLGQKTDAGAIGFPESEENPKIANKQRRSRSDSPRELKKAISVALERIRGGEEGVLYFLASSIKRGGVPPLDLMDRQPVYIPSMCPVNELYYPGYQKYDWICDCRPGYLYHPATDTCWLAFQRGPCSEGQYLVLPKATVIPVCEINPCIKDNYVMWNGKCEVLGSMAPCGTAYPANVLWVNATSVNLDCVKVYVDYRFATYNTEVPSCLPGCKRSINNKCVADPRR